MRRGGTLASAGQRMIPKRVKWFSGKIMRKQRDKTGRRWEEKSSRFIAAVFYFYTKPVEMLRRFQKVVIDKQLGWWQHFQISNCKQGEYAFHVDSVAFDRT